MYLLALYCDDKTPVVVTDSMEIRGEYFPINTVEKNNSALQIAHFNTNSQPYYVVVDTSMNPLAPGLGYVKNDSIMFEEMLQSALRKADSQK